MTIANLRSALSIAALSAVGIITLLPAAARADAITVVERATSDLVTDTGATGDSAGDILTFANKVYDEANQNETGSDNGWCVRTVKGVAWECNATVSLADGQLTVEGPFIDGKDSAWSVTGGTGKYLSARGEMQLHARNPEGSEYDFKFNLVP